MGNFERALRIHEAREHHAEHFQLQLGKERREFEARKTARQSVGQSARFSRRNERGDPESRETKHGGRLQQNTGGEGSSYVIDSRAGRRFAEQVDRRDVI